jgi:hypothetical protein
MAHLDEFMAVYERHYRAQVTAHPTRYVNGPEMIPKFIAKMREAIRTGMFVNDSPTFRATCKELGIKCTYKAIAQYIVGQD